MSILMAPFFAGVSAFVFNQTISADVSNYVLTSAATAAGWDGKAPLKATVTINSGIVVSANNTANHAFDTGIVPAGSALELVNNGYILGMGGAGGSGSQTRTESDGKPGGPALRAQAAINITNNGTIGGGGGGGAGCAAVTGSGNFYAGGGGGRTGRTDSLAGTNTSSSAPTAPATKGTFAASGDGGYASWPPSSGVGGKVVQGSAGATWGATASNSLVGGYSAYGGAGGAAVVGNSFITWLATGTRLGAIT